MTLFHLLVVAAFTKESPLNLLPLVSSSLGLYGMTYVPMLAYLRMVWETWKSSPVSNVIGRSLCFIGVGGMGGGGCSICFCPK